MGIRNLALVGTHEDYAADIYDDGSGSCYSTVTGCASAEDAARSYFNNIFENSNALIREARIVVWPLKSGREAATIYDAKAHMQPCNGPDAESGDYDIWLDVTEWRGDD